MNPWPFIAMALFPVPQVSGTAERRLPPPGIPVPEPEAESFRAGLTELRRAIDELPSSTEELLPDVEIFYKAVDWALRFGEFYDPKEFAVARDLLKIGLERARELKAGRPSWPSATGLVLRGYRSRIDGSVQPYGLVVPASWAPGSERRHRLDVWLHGRDEKLTELRFLDQRRRSPGEFTPADTIVLHPYGRYCNAFKFAGETDVFEALESVRRRYPVDPDRLVVRGFSMGGAGCWHLAAHHPGFWAAAAPGAGFAETPVFARVDRDPVPPAPYQRTLWSLYNATDYAANFFNLPVVAYSGELDRQRQAAEIMAQAMRDEGLELVHILGPKTEHRYHPAAKEEINRRIDEIASRGRDPDPKKLRFTTWTLKYPQVRWLKLDALERHWARARVEAEREGDLLRVSTSNVAAFRVEGIQVTRAVIDGQEVPGGPHYRKEAGGWVAGPPPEGLRKRPGLQGPIDDAFTEAFLVVLPTGEPLHAELGAWVQRESRRALDLWRRTFRGEARVKADRNVTDEDMAGANLVLWGDPRSNAVLGRLLPQLPLRWTAEEVRLGNRVWSGLRLPVLLYPNPLAPNRSIVLNSGFTFQEQAHLSNARQVPMLPDWAILDPAGGSILEAGFFGERWEGP
ncbi:MAG: prolyl oligopeptidase family serine peptidase [Planctomycetota bacterium]